MQISISSICARSGGEEIEISFLITSEDGVNTDRQSFIISSSQYLVIMPQKGEANEEIYDEISHASGVWEATKKGIFLLGYGACSERALLMKLYSKGFDKEIAAEAVEQIVLMGLLRAGDDASRLAEQMTKKLWGKKRIISALYEKGYSAEAVEIAINSLEDSGLDFEENCKKLVRKKYSGAELGREGQSKLYAALSRYGYSSSEIKSALLDLKEE